MIPHHVKVGRSSYVGAGAVLGDNGFGYEWAGGFWKPKPHPYGVRIGERVNIGSNTVIHRGRWRDTVVGDGTKIDALVFIAHNVVVGKDCLIVAQAMLEGSVNVGDRVIIGGGACIKVGVTIGDEAIVGMGSVVIHDVEQGTVVAGNPARYLRDRREDETL